MKKILIIAIFLFVANASWAQVKNYPPAKVNFNDFKSLVTAVEPHRTERLIDLDTFLKMSQEPDTIIFDSRSDFRFDRIHVKGARHLNFSDFTEENLLYVNFKDGTERNFRIKGSFMKDDKDNCFEINDPGYFTNVLSELGKEWMETQEKVKKYIRFDFTAAHINTFKETIEIKASLFNSSADTIYFLSSTCEGEQYSLRYDKEKFTLTPLINCNASFPIIIKIAPKGQHTFQAHFSYRNKETKITLGFDFYFVDRSFYLTNKNLGNTHIFDRLTGEQTIIWSNEKTIK